MCNCDECTGGVLLPITVKMDMHVGWTDDVMEAIEAALQGLPVALTWEHEDAAEL